MGIGFVNSDTKIRHFFVKSKFFIHEIALLYTIIRVFIHVNILCFSVLRVFFVYNNPENYVCTRFPESYDAFAKVCIVLLVPSHMPQNTSKPSFCQKSRHFSFTNQKNAYLCGVLISKAEAARVGLHR